MSDKHEQNKTSQKGLLPAGLQDLMPAEATREAHTINNLMDSLTALGYERVKPPLVEFEETLLADGPGSSLAHNSFRVMDPQSSRMMAIRADMTAQIARLAQTRMAHLPRPLRLAYCGDVLRIKPDTLNPERQLTQVGAEMIGAQNIAHDAELAVAALTALQNVGVQNLTIDLGIPHLISALTEDESALNDDLIAAVSAKDQMLVKKYADKKLATIICTLLDMPMTSNDTIGQNLKTLKNSIPKNALNLIDDLINIANMIQNALSTDQNSTVAITIDPLEQRGFNYHEGVGFSIFAKGIRGTLGRGGRYQTSLSSQGEVSTGVTLYLERVLRAVPSLKSPQIVYIPHTAGLDVWRKTSQQNQDKICRLGTAGLSKQSELDADMKSLGATHVWDAGKINSLK